MTGPDDTFDKATPGRERRSSPCPMEQGPEEAPELSLW
jgi:hypothetical protein